MLKLPIVINSLNNDIDLLTNTHDKLMKSINDEIEQKKEKCMC